MEVVINDGPGEQDAWAFVKAGSRVELGAQVVPSKHPTELVVVWRAAVKLDHLRVVVNLTQEHLRMHSDSFRGILTGYGPTKEFLNLEQFLRADPSIPTFDAYHARLETPEDAVVVWANVAQGDNRGLAEAADNIGIRTPLRSFDGWGGDVILHAISSTKGIKAAVVKGWLSVVMAKLLTQSHQAD